MTTAAIEKPTTDTKPLHLRRLEISNFMRVEARTITPDGKHVVISGPNGSGKSSTLEAIWAGLKGCSVKDTPEPIRKGQDKATVELDLGEYTVARHWAAKGTRLVVSAADGSKILRPQELLDGLLGKFSLDPVAFLERRPQDQVDDVLGIVGVQPPMDKVSQITGEFHSAHHEESADGFLMRLSADETGVYYVRRREAHRLLTRAEAAQSDQALQLQRLGGPLKAEEGTGSISDVLAEIKSLEAEQQARRNAQSFVEQHRQQLEAGQLKLKSIADQRARVEAEIAELQKRITNLNVECAALKQRESKGQEVIASMKRDLCEAEDHHKGLPDHGQRIADLTVAVQAWESESAGIRKRQAAAEQVDRLAGETAAAKADHDRLDSILNRLRHLRVHLLDGVDLGVPGLEIGQGELRLNGVSFRQASEAQRIRVAAAVAMRQNPRLKLLRVDNAEHLDSQSLKLLLDMASQHGWEVICARVADGEALKVEIVEGIPNGGS